MKEYPQEQCTNCDKKSSSWCVCKECRKNAKIVKQIRKLTAQADNWNIKAKKILGDETYVPLSQIIKNIGKIVGKTNVKEKK